MKNALVYPRTNKVAPVDDSPSHEINLQENKLKSIDDAFQHEINLKILNLSSNPLKQISSSAFNANVGKLRTLSLSSCQLSLLPPTVFRSLAELEKLDLSNNRLESIPVETFYGLSRLLVVNLKENQISVLGEVFRDNYLLKSVVLSGNNLQVVGNLLRGLSYLRKVNLNHNNLTVITEAEFSTSVSMLSLKLRNNGIHRIDSNAFLNMAGLKNLSLAFNNLTTLNGSLRNSRELKRLWLNHNQLREIGPSEMANLKKLMGLNLSFNNLTNVHRAFRNLTKLKYLNLYGNKLETITRSTFPSRIKIKKLVTRSNPWRCDCRLSWLLQFDRLAHQFRCVFPERFYRERVGQLTLHNLSSWSEGCDRSCECSCMPRETEFHVRVDCSSRQLTQIPAALPEKVGELYLRNNLLRNLTNLNKHPLAHLRYLDVERNFLGKIDFHLPKNLEAVKMAGNNLRRFPSYFPPSISYWTLSDNPWICDCETIQFWKFLTSDSKKIRDVHSVVCSRKEGKSNLYGKTIYDLTEYELCPEKLLLYILLGAILSILTLTAVGGHLVYTRYRYHLRVLLYSQGLDCLKKGEDRDWGKKHDAYLCFSEEDLGFVKKHVIPELEYKEPFYSLFVPPRDVHAGRFQLDQRLEEMENSKRIVIIVSQSFIASEVSMEIFRVAFASGLEEKKFRIIPIVLGEPPTFSELDPSLKAVLQTTRNLRFGQKLFWEMVRYAMPQKSCTAKVSASDDRPDVAMLSA